MRRDRHAGHELQYCQCLFILWHMVIEQHKYTNIASLITTWITISLAEFLLFLIF